jgi:hypothetical protein
MLTQSLLLMTVMACDTVPTHTTDHAFIAAPSEHTEPSPIERVEQSRLAILAVVPESCHASTAIAAHIYSRRAEIEQMGVEVIVLTDAEINGPDSLKVSRWLRRQFGRILFPSIGYFRFGQIVDMQFAQSHAPDIAFEHMLYRHGVIPDDPGFAWVASTDAPPSRDELLSYLSLHKTLSAHDMSNQDLSGLDLSFNVYSGTSFINANLTGTNLRDSVLMYANLCGARGLEPEHLEHVMWGTTICPDGTFTNAHGGSCDGHLTPASQCM